MRLCIFGAAGGPALFSSGPPSKQGHEVKVFLRKESHSSPPLGARAVLDALDSQVSIGKRLIVSSPR